MFLITKEFHFSASHQLSLLPKTHPCARLHGHNYIAKLVLASPTLDKYNFVKDFRELDFFKNYIEQEIDHRHLNDIFQSEAVTSEFLAKHFFDYSQPHLPQLYRLEVSETPKSWAIYCPSHR